MATTSMYRATLAEWDLNDKAGSVTKPQIQLVKFKAATKEFKTDDYPERFKERPKKIAKHKPMEKAE